MQRDVQLLQDGKNDLGTFSVVISTSGGESDKMGLIAAPFLFVSAFISILLSSSIGCSWKA